MSTKLDLQQLSIDREKPSSAPRPGGGRRRWLSRYALPLAVVLGFVLLVGFAAGRQLLPIRSVSVVPVIVTRAQVQQAGQALFQAPGWIEPRPTPTNVPALAPGILSALHVVEGQVLAQNEVVADLISIDAELALRRARATLELREGELKRAVAERAAAEIRLQRPVHLDVLVADAQSDLAVAQSELDQLPDAVRAAEAALAYAQESAAGKRAAGDGISGILRQRAEADLQDAEAKLSQLRNREPNLRGRVTALQEKVSTLKEQRRLLIEERRQFEEAQAKVETASATRDEARVRLEQAELQLERMQVRAPIDGRVLKLVASPGDRVNAPQGTATVIQMYDPMQLQVRVDVRLEDVPLVVPGQPVEVETAASPEPIQGYVLQPTSTANIQKNTLEVKVALLDPPPTITPEMLATTTFLAPQQDASQTPPQNSHQMFVPEELVRRESGQATVWIVDAEDRAVLANIQTGATTADGLLEVTDGLYPTDKLITGPIDGLSPDEQVKVVRDDPQLGMKQR